MKINSLSEMLKLLSYLDENIEKLDRFISPIVNNYRNKSDFLKATYGYVYDLKDEQIKNNIIATIKMNIVGILLASIVSKSSYSTVDITYNTKKSIFAIRLANDGVGSDYRLCAKLDYVEKMMMQSNVKDVSVRFENRVVKSCPSQCFNVNKDDVGLLVGVLDYLNDNNFYFYHFLGVRLPNDVSNVQVLSVLNAKNGGITSFSTSLSCSKFEYVSELLKPKLSVIVEFLVLEMDSARSIIKSTFLKI